MTIWNTWTYRRIWSPSFLTNLCGRNCGKAFGNWLFASVSYVQENSCKEPPTSLSPGFLKFVSWMGVVVFPDQFLLIEYLRVSLCGIVKQNHKQRSVRSTKSDPEKLPKPRTIGTFSGRTFYIYTNISISPRQPVFFKKIQKSTYSFWTACENSQFF